MTSVVVSLYSLIDMLFNVTVFPTLKAFLLLNNQILLLNILNRGISSFLVSFDSLFIDTKALPL